MWLHLPPSRSAPASECSTLDFDLPSMLARSCTLRGKSLPSKSWSRVLRTGRFTTLRSIPTSQRLTPGHFEASTSSPAGSPASRSASPGLEPGTPTNEPSPRMCCGSRASACRPWCSSKTFLPGFSPDTPESLSVDFKTWATASRRRCLSARRTSAHRIDASGCSSWPTAKVATGAYSYSRGDRTKPVDNLIGAAEKWPSPRGTDGEKGGPNQRGSKGDLMLPSAAAQWPTPRASDTNGPGAHWTGGADLRTTVENWATPNAHDAGGPRSWSAEMADGHTRSHDLQNQATIWATPAARDWKTDDPTQSPEHSPPLGRQVLRETGPQSTQNSGRPRLNPSFVEWLMGVPLGWTDYAPLETESFLSWWHTHSALCGED